MKNLVSLWSRRSRVAKVVIVLVVVGIAAGAAYAAWTLTASGPGTVKASTLQPVTVEQASSAANTACWPGSSCDMTVKVTNPNDGALVITGVAPNATYDGASPNPNCPATNFQVQTLTGLSIALAKGTTDNLVLPGAVTLDAAAPTDCQGTAVTKGVTLTVATP